MARKVLVNLATGMEEPSGSRSRFSSPPRPRAGQVRRHLGHEGRGAPRAAGRGEGEACDGCPPLERLFEQFAEGGGELWLCPICVKARGLDDAERSAT